MASPLPSLEELAAAEAERALEPYLSLIPKADREAFKEILRDELLAHPATSQMLRRLSPPPAGFKSDDINRETGEPWVEPVTPAKDGGSR